MVETFSYDALLPVLEWAKGTSFYVEQVPPLVNEIVMYGRVMHSLWLLLSLAIIVFVLRIRSFLEFGSNLFIVLWFVSFLVSGSVVLTQIYFLTVAWTSPRLYVIQYVESMTNGSFPKG